MKKILYIVATQYDNMGDLLINKCFVDELAEYGTVYLDTKKVPEAFKQVLLEKENVKELASISTISLKGLGLFRVPFAKNLKFDYLFKSPGPFGGSHSANQRTRAWLFYLIFLFFKKKGTKSFLMGNDFMLQTAFDKKIIRKYSKVLEQICLRSERNVLEVKSLGVENVSYSPDFCFMMKSPQDDAKNRVGISFRDMGPADYERVKKVVGMYVAYFTAQNIAVDFFYQVERDEDFNKSLYQTFQGPNVHYRPNVLTWEERNFYSDKLFLLSNRLHVVLLGQTYGGIPLALIFGQAKTQKIHDIYHTVGLGELIFEDISEDHLDQMFQSRKLIQERIGEVNRQQKQVFKSQLDKVL